MIAIIILVSIVIIGLLIFEIQSRIAMKKYHNSLCKHNWTKWEEYKIKDHFQFGGRRVGHVTCTHYYRRKCLKCREKAIKTL